MNHKKQAKDLARIEMRRSTLKIRCVICGKLTGGAISVSGPYICFECDCPKGFGNEEQEKTRKSQQGCRNG